MFVVGSKAVCDTRSLPPSLPEAWMRAPQKTTGGVGPPQPIPSNKKLGYLEEALSKLTQTSSAQSIATSAITERVQSCPWMRTLGNTTHAESLRTRHFIVQPTSQPRDSRPIDQRCIAIVEFGMYVRTLHASQIAELGQLLSRMSIPDDDDNGHKVSNSVYEALASISGMLDALRIGVGDDIACVMGGIAAFHSERSGADPETTRRVFNVVTRRIRSSGRLLSTAKEDRFAWMVLLDPHVDLDNLPGTSTHLNREERLKTVAAIALGAQVPILPDNCPEKVLDDPNAPHIRFRRSMDMMINSKGSWSLLDALIPCNAVPIRTKHYVTYVNAVSEYANKLVGSLAIPVTDHAIDSPERRCAWALVALSNPTIQAGEPFTAVMESWCNARAHQPPEKGNVCWIATRALLSSPAMDIVKLSAHLHELVAEWATASNVRDDMFGRIASFCVSTRTETGIGLICVDPLVAAGLVHIQTSSDPTPLAIDCLARSPSGALEFGDYESGFSEWTCSEETREQKTHLARDVACVIQTQICRYLGADRPSRLTNSALRLSLIPDNLLTKPWKLAIESFQPVLERAIREEVGCAFHRDLDTNKDENMAVLREGAIRAVVFRRRCLRALSDASRYPLKAGVEGGRNAALVTWLCNEGGECTVFARTFISDAAKRAEEVVVEYERLLRTASSVYAPESSKSLVNVQKSTRVTTIGLQRGAFLDQASRDAVTGPGTQLIEYCSGNSVLSVSSCAVSVVHWPIVSLR